MIGQRDPKFYSELKQLNEDLLGYLKLSQDKSPYFDFSPTVKDYVKQFADLEKQYPASQPSTMQPFLFGSALNPTFSLGSGAPSFSFTMPAPPPNTTASKEGAEGADEEDTLPPEPKIDKYEEPDAKHSVKCKLYEKGKGTGSEVNFNLLGIGVLYVKALETPSKLQVIVRQEPDLRRVLLNEVITSNIPVKLLPKSVQMIFPNTNGDTRFYIVKVKDEADASTLFETLNLAKS